MLQEFAERGLAVEADALFGGNRKNGKRSPAVLARREVWGRLRSISVAVSKLYSYPKLGRLFNRNHDNVLYNVRVWRLATGIKPPKGERVHPNRKHSLKEWQALQTKRNKRTVEQRQARKIRDGRTNS